MGPRKEEVSRPMGSVLWHTELQELLHTPLCSHNTPTHCSPSMRTLTTSLKIVMVEPRTKTEKKRVLMGSAILHWGCREQGLCEAGGTAHPAGDWESCFHRWQWGSPAWAP